MIFRVSITHGLWLLFSTLFLCSCITIDKTMGDKLIPTDQDLTLYTVSFDLPVDSKLTNKLPTNNFFFEYDLEMPLLFGACYDPLFGLTEAGTVFQFFPYNSYGAGLSYGDALEPVSLTLTLQRHKQGNIVLNQNQISIPQNVFVHEINNSITYQNAHNNSLLSQDWNPVPISLPGQIYFGADTLRISLSLDFARELLSIGQEEKDSTSLFFQRFKGLYIKTEPPVSGINTGRLNLLSSAEMTLRYKSNGADSSAYFYFSPYYGKVFNTITHSRASIDPHPSEHIYYQGFAGHKPYIDFVALTHHIRAWAKQSQIDIKKFLISRAEILLFYDTDTDYTIINQYPNRLYPYTYKYTDTTSYYLPVNNIYLTDSNPDGYINRSKYCYSMNVTSYLQSLLKKEEVTEEDNTWLMETTYYTDEYSQKATYHFSAYTYPLAVFKGVATDAKPIIKITYAVLK